MRKFLAQRRVTLNVHMRRRAVYTLANSLFTEENETRTALEMAHDILSNGNTRIQPHTAHGRATRTQRDEYQYESYCREKVAHNNEMRLKNSKQKFSGDLGQCWKNFFDEYKQTDEDYGLNEHQKLSYLHNLVSKDAHRYYLKEIKPNITSYSDAIETIEKETTW